MSLAPMRVVLVLAAACSGMNLRPKPTSDADQLPQVSASKKPPELLIDYEVTAGSSFGLLRVEARGLGVAWGVGCCLGWCVRANGEGALTLPRTSTPTHTHPHPSTPIHTHPRKTRHAFSRLFFPQSRVRSLCRILSSLKRTFIRRMSLILSTKRALGLPCHGGNAP